VEGDHKQVLLQDQPSTATEVHHCHFATDHLLTNLKGRTVSSGIVSSVAQCVQFVLTLISAVVLARLLTPRDFGLVAMVAVVMDFLRVFKDAGLSTATIQREGITHAQVSNLFWINVALSGGVSVIIVACAPAIAWFYREPKLVGVTLALSGTFLLTGLTVQHTALLNRQMRFKASALIQICSLTVGVSVGVVMAWLRCGYWALVGMQLTTPLVALLVTWLACPWRPQAPVRNSGTRSLVKFGADLSATNFIWSLARGADGLLIGRLFGSEQVGLYSRASGLLNRPLEQVMAPLNAVFVPVLSRIQGQRARYRRIFLQVYEAMALMSLVFTGLFLALSRPLTLFVLGVKWEGAVDIFTGFTISAAFLPLCSATSWLLASQGRGREWLIATSISGFATLASFLIGLPFGPAGVAFAYSGGALPIVLSVLHHVAGRSGPVTTLDLWRAFFRLLPVWGIVCSTAWLTRHLAVNLAPVLQLVVCIPAGLLVGACFVHAYPPARRVVFNVFETLREFKEGKLTVSN
jgi:O-antigen/teichoic acid export membrane protein